MTVQIDHNQVEEMLAGYRVESAEVVRAIAAKSTTVAETLCAARNAIRKYFGADVPVELTIKPDPEIRGLEPIVAEIRTPRGMSDAFERLQKFDDEWWLEVAQREPAEICILVMPE